MKPFRPLLAATCEDTSKLKFPLLASEKLDGIRMIVVDGICMSRSMKPIPSKAIQDKFGRSEYEGYDGELVYGDIYARDVFNQSTRFCMSRDTPPLMTSDNVQFMVFDRVMDIEEYKDRYNTLTDDPQNNVIKLVHTLLYSEAELLAFEEAVLAKGGEGVMLRSLHGRYKQGRSTVKEGILLKCKRFADEEATVIGFEEKLHNNNQATTGELGQTKRSSHKENMVPCGTLGALVVESDKWGTFSIGTGFDDTQRKEIWDNRQQYIGKLVKYKYFPTGVVVKPRFPVFLGWRHPDDV